MNQLKLGSTLFVSHIKGYTEEEAATKTRYHAQAKQFLKSLADALGLVKAQYDLRTNMAGPAISGETTLHAEHLYVQVSESCFGENGSIALYRSCVNRKDYTGGANHTIKLQALKDSARAARFIEECRRLLEEGRANAERAH